jgi:hypothetical protein
MIYSKVEGTMSNGFHTYALQKGGLWGLQITLSAGEDIDWTVCRRHEPRWVGDGGLSPLAQHHATRQRHLDMYMWPKLVVESAIAKDSG